MSDQKDKEINRLNTALERAYKMIGGLESQLTDLRSKLSRAEDEIDALSLDLGLNRK